MNKERKDKKLIIDCSCGENRFLRFWKFDEDEEWCVTLSYPRTSFFQKIRYIWKVIIQGEDWDTLIISDEDFKKIKDL